MANRSTIQRTGQSADLIQGEGEVGEVQGFWVNDVGTHLARYQQVQARTAGRYVVELRPILEGAEQLDVEPVIVVVDVLGEVRV